VETATCVGVHAQVAIAPVEREVAVLVVAGFRHQAFAEGVEKKGLDLMALEVGAVDV